MDNPRLIASKLFENIKIDDRVHPELSHCLYCYVNSKEDSIMDNIPYKIQLDTLTANTKQCPACKRVYLLHSKLE